MKKYLASPWLTITKKIQNNRRLIRTFINRKRNLSRGFTITELAITMGIMGILIGIVTINLASVQHTTSLGTAIAQVSADLHAQQLKAMIGDTEGNGSASNYGIHFGSTTYTLFKGSTYNANDTSNLVVPLSGTLQFTSPNTDIIFSQLSGKIQQATIEGIQDTTNSSSITLQINILGVIAQSN